MHKRISVPLAVTAITLVYLLFLVAGGWIMLHTSVHRYWAVNMQKAEECLEKYRRSNTLDPRGASAMALVYAEDGTLLADAVSANDPIFVDHERWLRPLVQQSDLQQHRLLLFPAVQENGSRTVFIFSVYFFPVFNIEGQHQTLLYIHTYRALGNNILLFGLVLSLFYAGILAVFFFLRKENEKTDLIRRSYVDNVTHSLKSPVAAIKALVLSMAEHELSQEQQSQYYGMILHELSQQENTIRSILELSYLQNSQRIPVRRQDAEAVFGTVLEAFRVICEEMEIRFRCTDCAALPALRTNAEAVQLILRSLLENAVKFTGTGGTVTVQISPVGKKMWVEVSDNGPGLEQHDIPHLFDRFYTGASTAEQSGSGLGLAIAKELTDALGETLEARSGKCGGAIFRFSIALA